MIAIHAYPRARLPAHRSVTPGRVGARCAERGRTGFPATVAPLDRKIAFITGGNRGIGFDVFQKKAGRLVNLPSILGSLTLHGDPASPIYDAKATAYDASKTALNAYTVHLAYELKGSSTKVNSAHPGWVQTAVGGSHAPMSVADGAKTSVHPAEQPAKAQKRRR